MLTRRSSPWLNYVLRFRSSKTLGPVRHKTSVTSASKQKSPEVGHVASSNVRPFKEIPGPRSFPVIGSRWIYKKGGPLYGLTRRDADKRRQQLWGDMVREERFPGIWLLHLYIPEYFEAVYRADGRTPIRIVTPMLHHYFEKYNERVQGLATAQGEEWYKLRSPVQQKMLLPKAVAAYVGEQNEVANDFLKRLKRVMDKDGVIEDLTPELSKYTMEAIGVVCFNSRIGALGENIDEKSDTGRFIKSVGELFLALAATSHSFLYRYFETPDFKRLVRAKQYIIELTGKYIQQRLDQMSKDATIDGEHGDLVLYLLTQTNLTRREAVTLVEDFFAGGVDTTSNLLAFALYALSKNPEKQIQLISELDTVLSNGAQTDAGTLSKLSYVRAVIKETLRMFPVAAGNSRQLIKDIVLNNYLIPAKTISILHHGYTAGQEKHFENADQFYPERWLRSETTRNNHPFAYMPFGFGARTCPGKRFAEQEVALALIKIFQNFTIEYTYPEDLKYDTVLVTCPLSPLKIKFTPRN